MRRKAVVQDLMKGAYIVDAFSGKDSLAEEILIGVRDRSRIDIEAGLAGVQGRQARTRRRGHAYSHARLQNSISRRNDAEPGVNDRSIQRMRHGPDHPRRGSVRKLRVGVQRDDIADVLEHTQRTGLARKAVVLFFEQPVQVEQLAALALPPHPDSLAGVEGAVPVQQQERPCVASCILPIQIVDCPCRQIDQRTLVDLRRTSGGVRQIGQQREVKIRILVREITRLKLVQQIFNLLFIEQQRRHHNQRRTLPAECPSRSRASEEPPSSSTS